MTNQELAALAYELRKKTVDVIVGAKAGHIGGDMSVMDTLVMLYFKHMNISPENQDDPNRDKFVLSKGYSVESYYTVLSEKGFFDYETYKNTFSRYGSEFIGHPHNSLPGVEMNSGSLGHGLPVCVGMALAGKLDQAPYRVYTVMGDGELAEGSVWEGAMAAGHYHLDNLCAVVDMYCVKPLDKDAILALAPKVTGFVTVEEHAPFGGLGSMVSQIVAASCPRKVVNLTLPDAPVITGNSKEVFDTYGLNAEGICVACRRVL